MPENILHKIKFLCRAISKVEWSGILLYTVEGSIKKPKTVKIILKDIIPMQKGSAGYTEYYYNEKRRDNSGYEDRMIDYFNDNPEAFEEDWRVGQIHSHNSMGTFFSGTDMGELEDNSASHDFYLSLIVNNWMDFVAKIAFRASEGTKTIIKYQALDEKGNPYTFKSPQKEEKKEKLFVYDCDVQPPEEVKLKVDSTFSDSVTDIIKKASTPIAPISRYGNNNDYNIFSSGRAYDYYNNRPEISGFSNLTDFGNRGSIQATRKEREIPVIDEFIISLLRGTNPPDRKIYTIQTALEEVKSASEGVSPQNLSNSVVEHYLTMFEKYFESTFDGNNNFIEISEEVVGILEDYEIQYKFLAETIETLKYMILKYNDYETTI